MSYHHKILGLQPGASKLAIKKAYRKKALQYHPDKNKSRTAIVQFHEITNAYACLLTHTKTTLPSLPITTLILPKPQKKRILLQHQIHEG